MAFSFPFLKAQEALEPSFFGEKKKNLCTFLVKYLENTGKLYMFAVPDFLAKLGTVGMYEDARKGINAEKGHERIGDFTF